MNCPIIHKPDELEFTTEYVNGVPITSYGHLTVYGAKNREQVLAILDQIVRNESAKIKEHQDDSNNG